MNNTSGTIILPKRKRKTISSVNNNCIFVEAWRGKCNQKSSYQSDYYCAAHVNLICAYCDNQATHNCAETGYGGVCGELKCDTHMNKCILKRIG